MAPQPEPPDEVLLARILLHPEPIATTSDLMPYVDKSRNALNNQLSRMVREGILEAKEPGEAAKVYWVTESGKTRLEEVELSVGLVDDN